MSNQPSTLDELLEELDSDDIARRSDAALRLSEFAEAAVDRLVRAVPRVGRANPGTLAFALYFFNCEDWFDEIFTMALDGNYEVQCHALNILGRQSFEVTTEQLREAAVRLEQLRPREGLPPDELELLRGDLRGILARLSAEHADPAQPLS